MDREPNRKRILIQIIGYRIFYTLIIFVKGGNTMAKKRANGEGSICKDKNTNRWRASLTIGRDDKGKLLRKQFYGKTKTEVLSKMDEYKAKSSLGLLTIDEKITLQAWISTWLSDYKIHDSRPSTLERYWGIYNNYIKNTELGVIKLKDLKAAHIQSYYNNLLKNKGKSADTIKFINKTVKAALSQAQKEQYILTNPCQFVTLPKQSKEKEEVMIFSQDEQKFFIKSLDGHKLASLFKLAFGTGLRQGELIALRWDDIDFVTAELKVSHTLKRVSKLDYTEGNKTEIIEQAPKTKYSARTIPIPSTLIADLKAHKKRQNEEKLLAGDAYSNNGLVFCTEIGNPIDARNLVRSYKRALELADIQYRKFHSLRHTYATRLFENDVPLKTVQTLLGHSSIDITSNIYTHVLPEEKIKAVDVLNSYF